MSYRSNSPWNDSNEIRCLIIFKKLQEANFPRGKQIKYCEEMSRSTNLGIGSISAKVCNFKSVAGVNEHSNSSANTVELYKRYGHLSIEELNKILDKT